MSRAPQSVLSKLLPSQGAPTWMRTAVHAMALAAAFTAVGCKNQGGAPESAAASAAATGGGAAGDRCNTAAKSPQDPLKDYGPSCTELLDAHPKLEDASNKEDTKVLCPFLRILHRSGALTEEIAKNSRSLLLRGWVLPVSFLKLVDTAAKFGCAKIACGFVAGKVSLGQGGFGVNVDIGRLHTAKGVAHDCGYTFALGDTAVNDAVRTTTLGLLKSSADGNGQLQYDDLVAAKKAACDRDFKIHKEKNLPLINKIAASGDTLEISDPDNTEIQLIYTYLGGVDNGYITYADVDRLFHAQLPTNKTKYTLSIGLFKHLTSVLGSAAAATAMSGATTDAANPPAAN